MASVVPVVSSLFKVNELDTISYIFQVGIIACLWCLIQSSSLKVPLAVRGRSTERSLVSLHSDHEKFVSGGSDPKKAKFFNNVIELFQYSPRKRKEY